MRKLELSERHKISFEILKTIDAVSKKHGLKYFLAAGTLLGAVRHKGFIPWDDDIDLWVMSDDYDKLNKFLAVETRYRVLNTDTTPELPLMFTKISDTNTILEQQSTAQGYFRRGISVDIFPIYPFKNTACFKIKYQIFWQMMSIFRKYKRQINFNFSELNFKGKITRLICKILEFLKLGDSFWIKRMRKFLSSSPSDTGFVFGPFGKYKFRTVTRSECFANSILLPFEGYEFNAPAGYDEVLRNVYGDYMKLPPKEKQVSNHNNNAYLLEDGEDFDAQKI